MSGSSPRLARRSVPFHRVHSPLSQTLTTYKATTLMYRLQEVCYFKKTSLGCTERPTDSTQASFVNECSINL